MRKTLLWILAAVLGGSAFFEFEANREAEAATVCIKLPTPTPTPPPGDTLTLGGTEYTIADHPRFTTPTRLSVLQARAVTGKDLWDALEAGNDAAVTGCTTAELNTSNLYKWSVGYLAKPTETAWRDCAINHFDRIRYIDPATFDPQKDYGSMYLAAWAYEYDILYSDLTAGQRSDFRDFIFNTWLPWLYLHAYDHRESTGNYNCHTEPTHNLCLTKWWGEYMFGMTCMGEDYRCDDLVEYNFDWYRSTPSALYAVKPVMDDVMPGCHPYSGSSYGRNRAIPYLLEIADAENTSLGVASWDAWMDDCPLFYAHSSVPRFTKAGCPFYGSKCSYFNAEFYPGEIKYNQGRNLRGVLLPLERDPADANNKLVQDWLVNYVGITSTGWVGGLEYEGHINTTYGKEYLGEWFLRYNEDAATTSYTTLPTTYGATGLGMVFSRDSWGEGDKFWMAANASSFIGDHQTTGCGSFKVFKNGEFGVVENDTRYAGGNSNQTALASYLENILFMGDGLVGTYLTGGFGTYGQTSTCNLTNLSSGASYAYWQSNLDAAYRTDYFPMTHVRRNFFHFKPVTMQSVSSENFVVILDSVDPVNTIAVKQFVYVPKTGPTVSDPNVTFTLTNTKTTIRRIYGDALTSEAVTDNSAISDCLQCGSGMARVVNSSAAAASHFLGLVITMQGTGGSLGTTNAISGASGALLGVQIKDGTAGHSRIALAPAGTATVSGTFTFTVDTALDHVEYVIAGLTAGQKYDHTKVGSAHTMTRNDSTGAITVDASGVARWAEVQPD